MNKLRAAFLLGGLAVLTACAHEQPHALVSDKPVALSHPARIGPWGVDLAAHDATVRPGDDFFRYANGHWLDTHEIPGDRARWGSFDALDEDAQKKVHELIVALPAAAPSGSIERQVSDFYRAYMDTAAINRAGLAPAERALEAISGARTHRDVATLMGRPDLELKSPIQLAIRPDEKNPNRYIVSLSESGLGLPDRDYYLKDDAVYADIRAKYRAHIERMLALAGDADAAAEAQAIVGLETEIAKLHWPVAKRRERRLTYNLRALSDLVDLAPGFGWLDLLAAAGVVGQNEVIVRELDAVANLGVLVGEVPVAQWRSYLRYHYLVGVADLLPTPFGAERFDFYGRTLNGQKVERERWKLAVSALNSALGEAVGQLYVERNFTPEARAQVLALVENLRSAYGTRIRKLPWMSSGTKKVALQKLATFRPKIGYPLKWRDYSGLEIRSDDAFGNETRAAVFEWRRKAARMNLPTDRDEWGITPQTINAYYNPTFNEVVFPAAILQPPFFDPDADPAVNYGGIGAVIGHEMGHGFDDQGAKSDAQGVLRTWWKPKDEAAFRKLVAQLAAQYDGLEGLPGLHVNGRLTLGENIGDLGGLSIAYAAYHLSLNGALAPVIDGLSGDQRFFLSWAQVWQALYRDAALRKQLLSDPHSPPQFRVNGAVRNIDAWYAAFHIQPSDRLYLPPEGRVHIW